MLVCRDSLQIAISVSAAMGVRVSYCSRSQPKTYLRIAALWASERDDMVKNVG
jgi:hypothetical protein